MGDGNENKTIAVKDLFLNAAKTSGQKDGKQHRKISSEHSQPVHGQGHAQPGASLCCHTGS